MITRYGWYPTIRLSVLRALSLREVTLSTLIALGSFIAVGTLTALWQNPLFVRMTPVAGFEFALLAAQCVLGGLYLGVRTPMCAVKTAGSGGILGFLGVACPVCNKVLLAIFGSGLLISYFEPVRSYVGLLGTAILLFALLKKFSIRNTSFGV
jgi:hypothetical protein